MIDLRITGGTIVDGTGRPARNGEVAVRDGRIVPDDGSEAARTIDAEGRVVAPGFVDIHTHYDAQLFWDQSLQPSILHGVTTVVSGNCGFTLSPADSQDRDYLAKMLANVEGIPEAAIAASVPWSWKTTRELLGQVERRGVAPNIAFLAGHSTIRRAAMGERARAEVATADDLSAMMALLDASLRDGAIGFGTSQQRNHTDGDHEPVPSRAATREEIVQLASVLRGHAGSALEIAPPLGSEPFPDDVEALLIDMSLAADRPVNWNILSLFSDMPELAGELLEVSDRAAERGACVAALFMPDFFRTSFTFMRGFRLEALPGWGGLFKLSATERIRALRDPSVRARLEAGARENDFNPRFVQWANWTVNQTVAAANAEIAGRTVGDIARQRERAPFDVMLDIVVADELATSLSPPYQGDDDESWRLRSELAANPWTIVGGSDAGAHVEVMCQATYPTRTLFEFRRRGLMEIEEIVRQLTDVPARYYGLRGRGRLAFGAHADVVVFDPGTVEPGPLVVRHDLPGDGFRVFADAVGIDHVIVNGTTIIEKGETTGAIPGKVMRSGQDTDTVDNAGGRAILHSAE